MYGGDLVLAVLEKTHDPEKLHCEPVFALGLLKILDPDVSRLIFSLIREIIPVSSVIDPGAKEGAQALKDGLVSLQNAGIVVCEDGRISLNSEFRRALLQGFSLGEVENAFIKAGEMAILDSNGETREQIILASEAKFQAILQAVADDSADSLLYVKEMLKFADLVDSEGNITSSGFEFLLKRQTDKCWALAIESIKYFAGTPSEEKRMLLDLMEICVRHRPGICKVARWCPWYTFLDSIGIIHVVKYGANSKERNKVDTGLYEAVLAKGCLANQDPMATYVVVSNFYLFPSSLQAANRYIILETNYKIYAYTDKPYEKSILSLFSKAVYILPNLIKSHLDEESLNGAFSKGISARQILKYFEEFARTIPANVENQIIIWEAKQNRIKTRDAVLYCDFLHYSDFLNVHKFLDERHAVLLKDDVKRIIVGTEQTYEETKKYIKGLTG